MQIWVDADACPKVIREILFRAAERREIKVVLVANQPMSIPVSRFIAAKRVPPGFDVADNYIISQVQAGDLIITADIPLAAEAVDKGAYVINPRGELYTADTIRQRLTMRNFMEEMRSTGQVTGGPPPLNQADRRAFANTLDSLLEKLALG